MTSESENLIAALKNVLSQLESTDADARNQESVAELKRILNHRIQGLESCASMPPGASAAAKIAD